MSDVWLDYRQAAVRVHRSERAVRRWATSGMPTRLVGGRMQVREADLLAWWRARLKANPVRRKPATVVPIPEPMPPLSGAARAGLHARLSRRVPDGAPSAPVTALRQAITDARADLAAETEPEVSEPGHLEPVVDVILDRQLLRRGAAEFAALQKALERHRPACAGDRRFTADGAARGELRSICAACPVLSECAASAAVAHPAGGIWAA